MKKFLNSSKNAHELAEIYNFFLKGKTFDCYCIYCGRQSVFTGINNFTRAYSFKAEDFIEEDEGDLTCLSVKCSRNKDHQYLCYIMISHSKIIKIGQYPSLADIAKTDIQKYRKVLKDAFGELSRGIGLAAHGIGIGSFVYLRRIFETLIYEAYDNAKKEPAWIEDQYQISRMDEKIILLKNHLPPFLVENRAIYAILSKGVHELSEQECLSAFPIVKLGIEMILDEKIREQKRQAKEAEAREAIAKLKEGLKGS
ncbi:MAG: short-chain dehydrogenase [Desulfobaccales bacterium]